MTSDPTPCTAGSHSPSGPRPNVIGQTKLRPEAGSAGFQPRLSSTRDTMPDTELSQRLPGDVGTMPPQETATVARQLPPQPLLGAYAEPTFPVPRAPHRGPDSVPG